MGSVALICLNTRAPLRPEVDGYKIAVAKLCLIQLRLDRLTKDMKQKLVRFLNPRS